VLLLLLLCHLPQGWYLVTPEVVAPHQLSQPDDGVHSVLLLLLLLLLFHLPHCRLPAGLLLSDASGGGAAPT
jgi:hypothetical protein